MSKHYEIHAQKIIEDFKKMIGNEASATLSQDSLDQLSMLIEAAISTSVLEELERAADTLTSAAARLRQHAERFDE